MKPKLVREAEERARQKGLHKAENKERFGMTKDVAQKRLRAYRNAASYERLNVDEELPAEVWGEAQALAKDLGLPSNTVIQAIATSDSPAAFWDELEYKIEDQEFDGSMNEATSMERMSKQVVDDALKWFREDGTKE